MWSGMAAIVHKASLECHKKSNRQQADGHAVKSKGTDIFLWVNVDLHY